MVTILEARVEFLEAEVVSGERCGKGCVERHLAAEPGGVARGRGKAAAASDEISYVAKSGRRKAVEAGIAEAAAERRDDKAENLRTEEMLLAVLKDLDGIPRCGEVRCSAVHDLLPCLFTRLESLDSPAWKINELCSAVQDCVLQCSTVQCSVVLCITVH